MFQVNKFKYWLSFNKDLDMYWLRIEEEEDLGCCTMLPRKKMQEFLNAINAFITGQESFHKIESNITDVNITMLRPLDTTVIQFMNSGSDYATRLSQSDMEILYHNLKVLM